MKSCLDCWYCGVAASTNSSWCRNDMWSDIVGNARLTLSLVQDIAKVCPHYLACDPVDQVRVWFESRSK